MMKYSILCSIALMCCTGTAVAQQFDRDVLYAGAMASFERADFASAADSLESAIHCDPIPSVEEDNYLPYTYLAVARFEQGQIESARDALMLSRLHGVASGTREGLKLLEQYGERILAAAEAAELPNSDLAQIYPQSNRILTDQEFEAIRGDVLGRCGYSTGATESKLPWYFHYEFGLQLIAAGDAQKGLDALEKGTEKRVRSSRESRMYGMWFIDYVPYYQMARASSRLGDWESANQAIKLSQSFGEFSPDDPDWEDFQTLEQLIQSKVQPQDS